MRAIRKLLAANRGEIALRIFRTAKRLGMKTVAVYTPEERASPHARAADEALEIPSYLDAPAVLGAAAFAKADAIHPGYGYLSESAAFSAEAERAGLIFLGPGPESMRRLGDKHAARLLAKSLEIPVSPGYDGEDQRESAFLEAAAAVGFPLVVKAVAGGGGRGMRLVKDADGLPEALKSARREAENAFGDGRLFLERLKEHARHIEVQLLGDGAGKVIHLGERDCTVQRRYQKVIEEAPAPELAAGIRLRLLSAAVELGRAVKLRSAATVEFLVDLKNTSEPFVFLEANCRIQVEHPVTEEITSQDLVGLQLRVARGEGIPEQDTIIFEGSAIEARIYAEIPEEGFMPAAGRLTELELPLDVRVEHALRRGADVSPSFDPLLAKIISRGRSRDEALRLLDDSLRRTVIGGVQTNRRFLRAVLAHERFRRADLSTAFIADELSVLTLRPDYPAPELLALFLATEGRAGQARNDPFSRPTYFRLCGERSPRSYPVFQPAREFSVVDPRGGGGSA